MTHHSAVARWLGIEGADRNHARDLQAIYQHADRMEARVDGIGRVQTRAMFATMKINSMRLEAERVAPEGAELYAMIAVAGAVEMANVLTRMSRGF